MSTGYYPLEDADVLTTLRFHPDGLSRTQLARILAMITGERIDWWGLTDALARLDEAGQVVTTLAGGPRRHWRVWRLAAYAPRLRVLPPIAEGATG